MNKALIELQRGCKATCCVILDEAYRNLGQTLVMDAGMDSAYLFCYSEPIFKEKMNLLAQNGKITYFVIRGIDVISEELQKRYVGLVKDREMGGYFLPSNVIIVFTVKDRASVQKIVSDLYRFCVVAF